MMETEECKSAVFVLHLMSPPEGNSEFCFQESLNVSRDEVEGNIESRGKTKPLFPEGADIKCFVI